MREQSDEEESLRQNIIEGCREMWDIYVETEREFHPLEEEVAQASQFRMNSSACWRRRASGGRELE